MGNLTATGVKAAKPGRHSDGGGLILDVKESGRAYWTLRYMRDGKRRDMVLGIADRDGKNRIKPAGGAANGQNGSDGPRVLSLLQARALAMAERARLADKAAPDPVAARKAERAAKQQASAAPAADPAAPSARDRSFRAVAEAFIATKAAGWKNGADSKHGLQWGATLSAYAYPKIGAKDVADITDADIQAILNPIWHTIPETASRLRGRLENILDAARAKGLRRGDNPAAWKHLKALGMASPRKGQPAGHFPSLPWQQMPAFVHALRQKEGVSARAILFAILTGARSGEVRGMRWGEVRKVHLDELGRDAMVWHVPAERMKAKKPHRVFLSAPALAVLQEMSAFGDDAKALVFPGARGRSPLTDMAMSMLVRGMSLDGLKEGEAPRWRDPNTDEPVTVHGMRSSFRVWAAATRSEPAEVVEAALAHTIRNAVVAAYLRTDFLAQRAALMEAWGQHVMRGPGEVAKLAERRTA
ncbi:tyrosine-type recombinase/integrase [Roseococcus thiosulfatophilus]|uniref:tyrosine-type recombinase/integrase n=1 Tax=Roseococcus thiosulfatophilus TaxID=35813 RepID=UPI001A8C63B7|nr:site-specific integrase [Roseococcus thiosulfatophilus]